MKKSKSPAGAPLKPRLSPRDIPKSAQIFVNRNLKMTTVGLIGFDMDHTLANYAPNAFEELAFEQAKRKLVEDGYPEAVAALRYDPEFVIRGLVVDKTNGNVIKMDRHHYVSRAFHGLAPLPDEERKRLYKGKKIPLARSAYASVDTMFSLPEVSLYAQLVDVLERARRTVDYVALYDDVREAVDASHRDGSIKSVIHAHPERFVIPDPNLPLTFDKFRRHGKKLFLLTNSEKGFTDVVMSCLLDGKLAAYPSWRDYFSLIVVSAGKPEFFVGDEPLKHTEGPRRGEPIRDGEREKLLAGGSAGHFERRVGFQGDQILYFGDHTYGDILRSKSSSGWRTAMILSELDHEIAARERAKRHTRRAYNAERALDRLISDRDLLEIEITAQRKRHDVLPKGEDKEALRTRIGRLKRGLRNLDRRIVRAEHRMETSWETAEAVYNRHWGPMFKHGNTLSRFAAQVARFACIYTSRASNFYYYPTRKFFKPHRETMPHEWDD